MAKHWARMLLAVSKLWNMIKAHLNLRDCRVAGIPAGVFNTLK